MVSLPTVITEVVPGPYTIIATISTQTSLVSTVKEQIQDIDLSVLLASEQEKVMSLLLRHESGETKTQSHFT